MNLVHIAQDAIAKAENLDSKLGIEDYNLTGMSGNKTRALLNNLCSHPGVKYLEVGMWWGSTFFSALKGNSVRAFGVDNWSEFQNVDPLGRGPFRHFMDVLPCYQGTNGVAVLNGDIFTEEIRSKIEPGINVYFYDGNHSEESHEKALTWLEPVLADEFVLVVDDWCIRSVQRGTCWALRKWGIPPLFSVELGMPPEPRHSAVLQDGGFLLADGDYPEMEQLQDHAGWWNGMLVAVLRKRGK